MWFPFTEVAFHQKIIYNENWWLSSTSYENCRKATFWIVYHEGKNKQNCYCRALNVCVCVLLFLPAPVDDGCLVNTRNKIKPPGRDARLTMKPVQLGSFPLWWCWWGGCKVSWIIKSVHLQVSRKLCAIRENVNLRFCGFIRPISRPKPPRLTRCQAKSLTGQKLVEEKLNRTASAKLCIQDCQVLVTEKC